jgi:hypothetical protein
MTAQPLNLPHSRNDSKAAQHLHRPRWAVITFLAVFTSIAAIVARYLSRHSTHTPSQVPSEGKHGG